MSSPREYGRLSFLLQVVKNESRHLQLTTERLFQQKIDADWVVALEDNIDKSEQLDAFVARFGRLQDTMADKLIPELMHSMAERPGSALDNLNRMEKLELVDSVAQWLEARNLRNRLIHEYMKDAEEFAQALNRALELVPALVSAFHRINEYAVAHGFEQSSR